MPRCQGLCLEFHPISGRSKTPFALPTRYQWNLRCKLLVAAWSCSWWCWCCWWCWLSTSYVRMANVQRHTFGEMPCDFQGPSLRFPIPKQAGGFCLPDLIESGATSKSFWNAKCRIPCTERGRIMPMCQNVSRYVKIQIIHNSTW